LKYDKEFTPGPGAFGHIMGDYDAGYYGYMYSFVFAADMYATVFKADPLDAKLGKPLVVLLFQARFLWISMASLS
jgi:Zn-dependent oligopeptidase